MSFEARIIENSTIKQRNLMRAAKIASAKPDTGVVIENKSAYFVIRDCADIAQQYIALLCYGSYTDPLTDLNGKLTEKEIIDFVARSQVDGNASVRHLLYVIFTDIARKEGLYEKVITNEPAVSDFTEEGGDIYGDYDFSPSVIADMPREGVMPLVDIDITDGKSVIDKLIDVFGATREIN
jgi:hypothetical protein|tara:strand:- start:3516 stop:4058 length:543 start_codon:yes stop_codon:yes gene_type:complete